MISVCLLTSNAQDDVSQLLPTVSFSDDIVIIDDHSTDNTIAIARARGCRVFKRRLSGDFSAARTYALSKAKHDWVLFLDPDETVSPQLAKEIIQTVKDPQFPAYQIKRNDIFLGKPLCYGETSNIWLTRLGRKNQGKWLRPVHEIWQFPNVGRLTNPLTHFPHKNITGFIRKINNYTDIEANYRYQNSVKISKVELVIYPIAKFLQNYLLRRGFLDGFEGFAMALLMSIHSWLVRAKLITLYHSHGK